MDIPIQARDVQSYYRDSSVVEHYSDASNRVGLWASERKVFTALFQPEQSVLELGCGAGRISLGLYQLGYRQLLATDFAREMVERGRAIAETLRYELPFEVADATRLPFEDGSWQGVIFGFNGLMQIPGRERRKAAMAEAYRVVQSGGHFVFTTHDRNIQRHKAYWKREAELWKRGRQHPRLLEYGDMLDERVTPNLYIHIPDTNEIRQDLKEVGFKVEQDMLRSTIANETQQVRDFSDECRFWIARKPD